MCIWDARKEKQRFISKRFSPKPFFFFFQEVDDDKGGWRGCYRGEDHAVNLVLLIRGRQEKSQIIKT